MKSTSTPAPTYPPALSHDFYDAEKLLLYLAEKEAGKNPKILEEISLCLSHKLNQAVSNLKQFQKIKEGIDRLLRTIIPDKLLRTIIPEGHANDNPNNLIERLINDPLIVKHAVEELSQLVTSHGVSYPDLTLVVNEYVGIRNRDVSDILHELIRLTEDYVEAGNDLKILEGISLCLSHKLNQAVSNLEQSQKIKEGIDRLLRTIIPEEYANGGNPNNLMKRLIDNPLIVRHAVKELSQLMTSHGVVPYPDPTLAVNEYVVGIKNRDVSDILHNFVYLTEEYVILRIAKHNEIPDVIHVGDSGTSYKGELDLEKLYDKATAAIINIYKKRLDPSSYNKYL